MRFRSILALLVFLVAMPDCKRRDASALRSDTTSQVAGAYGKVIVITDMEPDDRMALMLLASYVPADDIAFMGTTVLNAKRKKALLCQLNQEIGYGAVPVYQGRGRLPDFYKSTVVTIDAEPEAIGTVTVEAAKSGLVTKSIGPGGTDQQIAATGAARAYPDEGIILDQFPLPGWRPGLNAWLKQPEIDNEASRNSSALTDEIVSYLSQSDGHVTILQLTAPTELEEALSSHPELAAKIERVYFQGGWQTVGSVPNQAGGVSEPQCPPETIRTPSSSAAAPGFATDILPKGYLCATSYNWNMDLASSIRLMRNPWGLQLTLLSSHVLKTVFPSGSINDDTAYGKKIWQALDSEALSSLKSVRSTRQEIGHWDEYILNNLRKIPNPNPGLVKTISTIDKFKDRQFTPADPAVVLAYLQDAKWLTESAPLVTSTMKINVAIDPRIVVRSTGWAVTYDENPQSKIVLATGMDPIAFGDAAAFALMKLNEGDETAANSTCAEFNAPTQTTGDQSSSD